MAPVIDLHVHSALSPCGGDEMTPPAVLLTAERRNVAVLGIVDHSTAGNAAAFFDAAQAFNVRVLAGLEVESIEGVHVLTLFDDPYAAQDMDAAVAAALPRLSNRPSILGHQSLLDEMGEVVGEEERLLIIAAALSVEQIAGMTASRGGLAIPAHVDRPAGGLLAVLGFVPQDLEVDLLELSPHISDHAALVRWPELAGQALVRGSDAHYIVDIGRSVTHISAELAISRLGALEWGRAVAGELLGGGD